MLGFKKKSPPSPNDNLTKVKLQNPKKMLVTPPKFNSSPLPPETWCLEDDILSYWGNGNFSGANRSTLGGKKNLPNPPPFPPQLRLSNLGTIETRP